MKRARLGLLPALALIGGCAAQMPPQAVPTELSGTHWRVSAVNGRSTPASGDYHLRFDGARIGAKFGCNGIGGRWRIDRGRLIVSDMMQTLMGCSEPSMSFETQGSAVLREPMRIDWTGRDSVTLASSTGSIMLERAP